MRHLHFRRPSFLYGSTRDAFSFIWYLPNIDIRFHFGTLEISMDTQKASHFHRYRFHAIQILVFMSWYYRYFMRLLMLASFAITSRLQALASLRVFWDWMVTAYDKPYFTRTVHISDHLTLSLAGLKNTPEPLASSLPILMTLEGISRREYL